ncbi:TetR/AcrR family transcriptional regulator [Clostridium gasigenes]|uniref:TetR/AcrR family transcriptional regulator n=1 Tax=Clostridium gasigenes TaxID=94869 RepID=UPI001C0E529E|nr:TetR/AcrR family transcriptional regulator [Clostridium gasigenes]MBU3104665.1 TetR/AcrR family transcriptional regulator [Clostridium gasigenes]MBU3133740.1 TetR/AcrR family transcriptional regulator [Clostridium gasigenes]
MGKKEEILEAAYKHFSKRGYNVSMADIAKEVGIKTPSLYSHFISKDEIVYLIVEKEVVKYNEFLNNVYNESNHTAIDEKFKNIFFDIIKYFKDNDKLRFWRNILLIDNDDLRKKCSELVFNLEMFHIKKMEEAFEQSMLKNYPSEDEIESNALLFLAMIQGALEGELLCYGSTSKAEEFIAKTWKAYCNGVLNNMKCE